MCRSHACCAMRASSSWARPRRNSGQLVQDCPPRVSIIGYGSLRRPNSTLGTYTDDPAAVTDLLPQSIDRRCGRLFLASAGTACRSPPRLWPLSRASHGPQSARALAPIARTDAWSGLERGAVVIQTRPGGRNDLKCGDFRPAGRSKGKPAGSISQARPRCRSLAHFAWRGAGRDGSSRVWRSSICA